MIMNEEFCRLEARLGFIEEMLWHIIDVQEQQIECGRETAKLVALDADVKKRTARLKAAVKAATPNTP
jgi:hypothetical protein